MPAIAALPMAKKLRLEGLIATFVVPAPKGCNLNCSFCIVRARHEAPEGASALSVGDYVRFLDAMAGKEKIGVMSLQGSDEKPELPPIGVVNDYLTAWLAQAGIVSALRQRAEQGGSYHVRVSLTRVALWILSMGIFDREWALRTAGSAEQHRYLDPETFRAVTPMGDYQGVTDQVSMSVTPGTYDPVLVPRGSSRLEWLAR